MAPAIGSKDVVLTGEIFSRQRINGCRAKSEPSVAGAHGVAGRRGPPARAVGPPPPPPRPERRGLGGGGAGPGRGAPPPPPPPGPPPNKTVKIFLLHPSPHPPRRQPT